MPQDPFDPQTGSFAFANYWTLNEKTIGEICRQMDAAARLVFAFLAPVPGFAPLRDSVTGTVQNWVSAASVHAYGLCGGMAFAALDYYTAGLAAPDEPGPTNNLSPGLRAFIVSRMIDSLAGRNLARVLAWMVVEHRAPFGSGKRLLLRWTRGECSRLKELIAQNGAWPIALIGESKDPCHNHQVLAYRCELEPEKCLITVYDVNYPRAGRELTLDLRGPNLQVPNDRNDAWQPLRGLFCEDYSPASPPRTEEISLPHE